LEGLTILIIKNHLLMHLVESQWLKRFSLHLCPRVILLFSKQFLREILLELVEKSNNYMFYLLGWIVIM